MKRVLAPPKGCLISSADAAEINAMKPPPANIAAAASIVLGVLAFAQTPDEARSRILYERRDWFELREAVKGRSVSPLYLGAVASAFSQVEEAEKRLAQVIKQAPHSEDAREARELLTYLYLRIGRSADAGKQIDEQLKAEPNRADLQNLRTIFSAFGNGSNLEIRSRNEATIDCEVNKNGVHLPMLVNGHRVTWLLDTGANISVLSDREAASLGVAGPGAKGRANDLAGGAAAVGAAVIQRMMIGQSELRNVPVIMTPASQPPWTDLPAGRQGAIGLPVAIALGMIGWTGSGSCRTGISTIDRATAPNLAFDGLQVVSRVSLDGAPVDFVLDTGNQRETQLWERFRRDFPALVAQGRSDTRRVTQIGGANDRDVTILPGIRLRVGGIDARLEPAVLFSKPVGDDRHHGNLGMDILRQASEVAIDFRSMSLTLR